MQTILLFFLLIIIAIITITVVKKTIKLVKENKAKCPLTLEEKIVLLNNQLSAGTITKEEYDNQKAELLKNI